MTPSSESLNLEVIAKAIEQHNANCDFPATEVAMNPFEVERLGWDQIKGVPIVDDSKVGTGRFEVRCDRDKTGEGERTEAVAKKMVPAGGVE